MTLCIYISLLLFEKFSTGHLIYRTVYGRTFYIHYLLRPV
jgi:hypothetical protein